MYQLIFSIFKFLEIVLTPVDGNNDPNKQYSTNELILHTNYFIMLLLFIILILLVVILILQIIKLSKK